MLLCEWVAGSTGGLRACTSLIYDEYKSFVAAWSGKCLRNRVAFTDVLVVWLIIPLRKGARSS